MDIISKISLKNKEPVCHTKVLSYFNQTFKQNDLCRIKNYDERFTKISVIGTGRFGAIEKIRDNEKDIHVSAKVVNLTLFDHWMQNFSKIKNRVDVFLKEYKKISNLSKQNERISEFYGIFSDSERIIILMEFADNGTVKDKINFEGLEEIKAVKYFYQAAQGLEFLHSQQYPIYHRDVKAANLLITKNDDIKLANFGLVRDLTIGGFGLAVASEITEDFRFTLLYVAPEVLLSDLGPADPKSYNSASDIWALGCTFVEMLTKYPPYYEYYDGNVGFHHDFIHKAKQTTEKQLPFDCFSLVPTASMFTRFIINKVFDKNPLTRISANGLIQFLESVNIQYLDERQHLENEFSKALENSIKTIQQQTQEQKRNMFQTFKQMSIQNLTKFKSTSPTNKNSNNDNDDDSIDDKDDIYDKNINKSTTTIQKRRKKRKKRHQKSFFENIWFCIKYWFSRLCCFTGILCKSISYVVLFVFIGLGTLSTFFCLATGIVFLVRLIVSKFCECDLNTPQVLIISGIFLILLFALFFSCCMVALGEYKFRVVNKSIQQSKFFVQRPSKDVKLLGITVVRGKKKPKLLSTNDSVDDENDIEIEQKMPQEIEMDEFYESSPTPIPSDTEARSDGRKPAVIQEEPSRKYATVSYTNQDFNDLYCNQPNAK